MIKHFNLSEKIEGICKTIGKSIPLEDVKEFIKRLKEELHNEWVGDDGYVDWYNAEKIIDKLAGDDLK